MAELTDGISDQLNQFEAQMLDIYSLVHPDPLKNASYVKENRKLVNDINSMILQYCREHPVWEARVTMINTLTNLMELNKLAIVQTIDLAKIMVENYKGGN